jgi:hypothetical protein
MPSIATVTVLTGSFMAPMPTDVPQALISATGQHAWPRDQSMFQCALGLLFMRAAGPI